MSSNSFSRREAAHVRSPLSAPSICFGGFHSFEQSLDRVLGGFPFPAGSFDSRRPQEIDPAEILRLLATYTESEADRQLLNVLAGAVSQLREVQPNLPPDQSAVIGELIG
jgi:hypothetical protein